MVPESNFGVIFDSDGVLVDSEIIEQEILEKYFKDLNITLSKNDIEYGVGVRDKEYIDYLNKKYNKNILYKEEFFPFKMNWYTKIAEKKLRVFEGIYELINDLKKNAVRIAVASSASKEKLFYNLKSVKLFDTFDVIMSGEDVEAGKPSPEIFLKTAQRLQLPPSRCVVIEDALNGIAAAKNAGMFCIAVTNTFDTLKLSEKNPDIIVKKLSDISYKSIKELVES